MRHSQRWSETTRCAARAGDPPRRRARWLAGALLSLLFGLVLGALAPAAAAAEVPAFTTTPAATTNDTTPSWAGTLPAGATAECSLTRPDGSTATVACDDGAGGFAATVAAAADGVYTLTVVAVTDDGAGGTVRSAPVGSSTTVDTDPPSVSIVTEPASPGTDRTPTWEVAVESGASATCQLTAPGYTATATLCSGAWTADLTSAGEAVYVLTVTATDDAGNTASVPGTGYELLLPPATPTVTPPPSPGNDPAVSWAFTVPGGATATCSLAAPGGSTLIPAGSCSSPWATSLSAGDGTYTATVVLTDSGGASEPGTASAVLDTLAPGATTVTGTSGRTTNPEVSWAFTAGGSTALCRLEQDGALGAEAPCTSPWTGALGSDGTYRLGVVLVDAAGNRSPTAWSPSVTLDRAAPATPAITFAPASPTNGGAARSFTWNHTVAETTQCRVTSGSTVVRDWATCTGSYTLDVSTLGDGGYQFEVRSLDDLGNTSGVATSAVELDATAPAPPTVTAPSGPSSSRIWTVDWQGEPGAVGTCVLVRGGVILASVTPCADPWDVDLGGQPDGTYTARITVTDAAGNQSVATSVSYPLDTLAPAVPTFTVEPATSSSSTPRWEFGSDSDATLLCALTAPDGALRYDGVCTSPYLPDLGAGADGSYTLAVRARDAAGNTSAAATSRYLLDTAAPAAPVLSAASGPSNDRTWLVGWTAEPGSTATCTLLAGSTVLRAATACLSPYAFDLAGLADGVYTASVTVTDAAGNVSSASTVAYTLDTTPPSVPRFAVTPPTSSTRTPRWEFSSDAGATLLCRLLAPDGTVLVDGACTSPFVPDLTGGADGTYPLEVRARDAAGNVSAAAVSSYVLDTAAPAAPVVTAPTGPSSTRSWEVSWTGEAGTAAGCELARGGVVARTVVGCTSPYTVDLTGLADGSWTLSVRLTDAAGNTGGAGTATYTLDSTPPAVPTFTAEPPTSSERTPTWEFRSDQGSTLLCRLVAPDGTVLVDGVCTSPLTQNLSGRPDGDYVLEVRARDAVGNVSAPATSIFVLDTAAPADPSVVSAPAPSADRTPTWELSGPSDAVLLCRLTAPDGSVWSDGVCSRTYTPDLTGGADGGWTLAVTARDQAANLSGTVTSTYLLDTVAPADPVFTSEPATSADRSPTWTFSGESGATLTCRVVAPDGTLLDAVTCSGSYTAALAGLADGTYRLEVRAVDVAGNLSGWSVSTFLLDTDAPAAPLVSGESGPSSSRTWTVAWTGEAGAAASCELRLGATVVRTAVACSGPYAFDLTGLADGGYTAYVTLTDAAGNTSAAGTAPYELDSTAPGQPVFTVQPPTSFDRAPRWEFGADAGTTLLCTLTAPDGAVLGSGVCTSPYVADLTGLPDGAYLLTVRARDAAGNVSTAAGSGFVLDTAAPAPPAFTATPAPTGSFRDPSWSLRGPADATLECTLVGPAGALTGWTACAGSHLVDLTGSPDGTYLLRVRARDAAGNLSAVLEGAYVLDTAAPAAVVVTPPASPGNVRAPRWTFTAEAGASIECRSGSGTWQVCGGELVLDLSTAGDGTYVVEVRAVDAAGNVGPVVRSEYVLDTTAPAAAVFTAVPPTSYERTPRWSFSGEAGAVLLCRLTGPTGAVLLDAVCSSPLTADLAGQPDGSYLLRVLVRDAAGNVSPAATSTFVLDTAPPADPAVTAPATPGNTRMPVWGIASTGTNSCRLLSGGVVLVDWTACGTSYTADLSGRPDGSYVLEVRTQDAAGNVSGTTSSPYRLDTAPPPAPGVVAPSSPSSGASPTWTVTSTEAGATAACRVWRDGTVVRDWAPCTATTTGSPFSLDLAGLADGSYRLEVRLTDAAGNTGATAGAGYVYDTTPPAPVTVTAPASPGSTRSPTWRFATELGARLECRLGDAGPYTPCGAELVVDLSAEADGTYAVWARAIDVAGNVGTGTRTSYLLDTRAPAAPLLSVPTSPSADTAPQWAWTGEAGATAWCELTRDGVPVLTGACVSPWSPTLDRDGTWTLSVQLVDAAGNVSAPESTSYVLDTTAPDAPVVAGPGSPNSLTDPMFSFTAESGALLQCRLSYAAGRGGYRLLADWRACTSPASWTTGDPGSYLVEVRAVDRAGNVGAVTGFVYEYDPDAPAGLRELTPAASPSTERLPVWTFEAAADAVVTCRLVGPTGEVLLDTACSGSVTPPRELSVDGVYRLTVTVRDGLGNVGVNEVLYELDTTGPAAPVVAPRAVVGQDGTVSWSWTGDAAATWECRLLYGGMVVRDWRDCTPYRQSLVWGEGDYVLDVRGYDALGTVGSTGRGGYTWDVTAPAAVGLVSSSGSSGTARLVTWTFQPPPDAVAVTCAVRSGRTLIGTPSTCGSGSYVMDLRSVDVGRYDLVVLLTDRAGNTRELTASYTLLAVTAPVPPSPAPRPDPKPVPGTSRPPAPGPAAVQPRPAPAIDPTAAPTAVSLGRALREDDVPTRGAAVVGSGTPGENGGSPAGETTAAGSDAPFVRGAEPALGLPSGPVSGARAVEALKDVAGETIRRPTLPIALLLVVGLFLLVQNRIDRRDPKLAGAAVDEEPDLEFRTFRPGGATT